MTRVRIAVVDSLIDRLTWPEAEESIAAWAARREPRVVCICNVHSVVTARSDAALQKAINEADLATPDGMPVAWMLRHLSGADQARINGPDLTLRLCALAEHEGHVVAFYGSTPHTLELLRAALAREFPRLHIGAMISPPFRALTPEEDAEFVAQINASGAALVFVGLGCPKQEVWMAAHREQVQGVQLGVGAAFDYIAGTVKRPPRWMQEHGLEWLGRLVAEPRRLWRRYLKTNFLFILYACNQLRRGRPR